MEIFGGFMVMMSIISLFLAVVWLIMPFVVFAVKAKQDKTLELLEVVDKRLAAIEAQLEKLEPAGSRTESTVREHPAEIPITSQTEPADSTGSPAENI